MSDDERRDALAARIHSATIGALELFHIYVGDKLGLYSALSREGPLAPDELASAAGISPRYAREWLEQEAVAGIVDVVPGDERRFSLPPGHAQVLDDPDDVNFMLPIAKGVAAIGAVLPQVLEAFKSGGGVPYEAYGSDMREAIGLGNRPGFIKLLGASWFPAIPDLDRRLRDHPPARVADVGCGTGWSSIGMAMAYPLITVDGLDLDAGSIKEARRNAGASGVADRVKFQIRNAADPKLVGAYDLVTAFETIHDMSDPVSALRAMRGLAREGATVIVVDEKVAGEFTAPGDETERYMYGWSALHCLPVGMVDPGSAGTGTVMRPARLRQYAIQAGFQDLEVLQVEADTWRFYRLR